MKKKPLAVASVKTFSGGFDIFIFRDFKEVFTRNARLRTLIAGGNRQTGIAFERFPKTEDRNAALRNDLQSLLNRKKFCGIICACK